MVNKIEQRKKRTNFPGSRIKKIMLTNEDIGKISPPTPIIIGKSLDQFLSEIIEEGVKIVKKNNGNKITENVIDQIINDDDRFLFLRIKKEE